MHFRIMDKIWKCYLYSFILAIAKLAHEVYFLATWDPEYPLPISWFHLWVVVPFCAGVGAVAAAGRGGELGRGRAVVRDVQPVVGVRRVFPQTDRGSCDLGKTLIAITYWSAHNNKGTTLKLEQKTIQVLTSSGAKEPVNVWGFPDFRHPPAHPGAELVGHVAAHVAGVVDDAVVVGDARLPLGAHGAGVVRHRVVAAGGVATELA